jgi:hypothetical protein
VPRSSITGAIAAARPIARRRCQLPSGTLRGRCPSAARSGAVVSSARLLMRRPGSASVLLLSAATRYLPVGRWAAPRGWPARPGAPLLPARAAPWTGGGVRRTSSRRARSSRLSSFRVLSVLGCTVRNTGPRARSMTATITFELLGVSNTIPSCPAPSSATVTRSPAPIDSIAASVLGRMFSDVVARHTGVLEAGTPDSWVRCICGGCGRVGDGPRLALQRLFGPPRRRRDRARLDLVCPWCARGGLVVPQSRRSRLTLLISGGGRRGSMRSPTGPSAASCEAVLLTPVDVRSYAIPGPKDSLVFADEGETLKGAPHRSCVARVPAWTRTPNRFD